MPENDRLTSDELRAFEAQVDSRFEGIAARFAVIDERFGVLGERLEVIERQLQVLVRAEVRSATVERRLDATRVHADLVRTQLVSELADARRDLGRHVVLGLVGMTVVMALLCVGAVVFLM